MRLQNHIISSIFILRPSRKNAATASQTSTIYAASLICYRPHFRTTYIRFLRKKITPASRVHLVYLTAGSCFESKYDIGRVVDHVLQMALVRSAAPKTARWTFSRRSLSHINCLSGSWPTTRWSFQFSYG